MNCVDPLRQIKVQFEIPWVKPYPFIQGWTNQGWSTHPNGPWDPKKPSLSMTGFAVLQWVHHFTKKTLDSNNKKHPFKTIPQKQGVVHILFVLTWQIPKNLTNYSIGCWDLLMIPWMKKISPFPKEMIGIVESSFFLVTRKTPGSQPPFNKMLVPYDEPFLGKFCFYKPTYKKRVVGLPG